MKIKLIVTDLDGTLLRTDKTVSDRTIQVLQKCREQGIAIAMATARYWIATERYRNLLHPDYLITGDGTVVHCGEELVCECGFSREKTDAIIAMIQSAVPEAEIVSAADRTVYWNSLHIAESDRLYRAVYFDYKSPLPVPAHKIAAYLPNRECAEEIAARCGCKLICYRGENMYAFIPEQAGKAYMIQQLVEKLQISLENVVAFGDDGNDLEMLQLCGVGVAVANALPEIKKVADHVTLSNDEDGVAVFMEQNVL